MTRVLAVLEQRDGRLRGVSAEVVSAAAALARDLGGEAEGIVLGGPGIEETVHAAQAFGARRIRVGSHEALAHYRPEGYAEALAGMIREGGTAAAVLFSATATGKDLAPRVAALLDLPLAQDVTGISGLGGRVRMVRPVYAGKANATIEHDAAPVLATIRPGAISAVEGISHAEIEPLSLALDPERWPTRRLSFEPEGGDIPDVSEAAIVVSGGRGLRDPANWAMLEELRAALGSEAGLGASRAVVDAGWRSHSEQVGQTGKTVAPRLYFAIGISGAVQHLAGMRTARTIVAVNRDRDAPIFRVADYGIVGDAFEVVPRLAAEIRARKES
ncbi:MAG: electron transfer flavoprotein subunit alpha/FixB family protein [Gemmatimonadota bacterium]